MAKTIVQQQAMNVRDTLHDSVTSRTKATKSAPAKVHVVLSEGDYNLIMYTLKQIEDGILQEVKQDQADRLDMSRGQF